MGEGHIADLRYALRRLWASPGFTAVAILSLAIGIGANTAIFQLIDAVLLRTLPVARPHELAEIKITGGNHDLGVVEEYGELTRPIWEEIRRDHPAFSDVFAWGKDSKTLSDGPARKHMNVMLVSGNFFRVLGVRPFSGRLVEMEDEHACPETTAVVSYAFQRSHPGQSSIVLNGERKQVVGVMPPMFQGVVVGERFDVVLPLCRPSPMLRDAFDLSVMGRLAPGWDVRKASAQLAGQSSAIMDATAITGYDAGTIARYRSAKLSAFPAASGVSRIRMEYETSLRLLFGITGLVLLIACANIANLMLARTASREREMAVRLALGAGRARLIRQLLVESAMLAAAGAVAGLMLAPILTEGLVRALSTENDPVSLKIGTDWMVLLFLMAVAGLTCLAFGLLPAMRASSADPISTMKSGTRGLTQGRERFWTQRALVVTQVAISLVLLTGALLFVRSFYNLIAFDPGIRRGEITTAYISPMKPEMLDEIRGIPGVMSAANTTMVPLTGGEWSGLVNVGSVQGDAGLSWVSPGYFETVGVPLTAGRDFRMSDQARTSQVAIVNQCFVRKYFGKTNPIGQTFRRHQEPGYPAAVLEVIGVIPDTPYGCLRCGSRPEAFGPIAQLPKATEWTGILIRSKLGLSQLSASVRERLAVSHPGAAINLLPLESEIRDTLIKDRLLATLSGFFGLIAAALGTLGLYGVVSYLVTRRQGEIGIRMALGATRGEVIAMVMRESGSLLLIGLGMGAALTLGFSRNAGSLLFGLAANDPFTLGCAILLIGIAGAAASFVPARRATLLDPMTAVRSD